jgi:hypothetical protein
VVLLTGFIAGARIVGAYQEWRQWQSWLIRDASAADAYRTFFLVDLAVALVSLAIAGLVWYLLREPPGNQKR